MGTTKIELKRPVCLGGQELKKGVHEVGDAILNHWMIRDMISDGDAVVHAQAPANAAAAKAAIKPTDEAPAPGDTDDELAAVKSELDALGVKYSDKIGLAKAKARLEEAKAAAAEAEDKE
jgi:hypothetical protein